MPNVSKPGAVNSEGRDVTLHHVKELGARHGIKPARIAAIVDEVRAAVSGWSVYAADTGVGISQGEISAALARRDRDFAG
ncbi:MAG: hypothetical protein R3E18_07340 [Sphingomonadaceae bacterium]